MEVSVEMDALGSPGFRHFFPTRTSWGSVLFNALAINTDFGVYIAGIVLEKPLQVAESLLSEERHVAIR